MFKIYTDGSTRENNKRGAKNIGGCGYVVYDIATNYIADAFSLQVKNTTNNEMELMALYYAIAHYGTEKEWDCPEIYSDSLYAINCITTWSKKWMINGWVNAHGKPVENANIISAILNLIDSGKFHVNLNYCKGHNGVKGNELADKLATGEMTADEVYYSDVVNNIPNKGYFFGRDNWKSDIKYKDDPQYWIIGIEDGWIYPSKELGKWYKEYRKKYERK